MQGVTIVDHPLVQHKLSLIRDKSISTKSFRELLKEIGMLLCYEVTRDLPLTEVEVETPLTRMWSARIAGKKLVFVPVLRAGATFVDGMMDLVPTGRLEQDRLFKDIGIEPLAPGFNAKHLATALEGKKTPIKSALLDQRVVAGLGNIYVSEALFRGRISPKRLAGSLKPDEIARLVPAIKTVLKDAIKAGGSSLRDHARPDGELGMFQHRFLVYDREGQPCKLGCKGTVKRIVQAGRSTFYCPKCQK